MVNVILTILAWITIIYGATTFPYSKEDRHKKGLYFSSIILLLTGVIAQEEKSWFVLIIGTVLGLFIVYRTQKKWAKYEGTPDAQLAKRMYDTDQYANNIMYKEAEKIVSGVIEIKSKLAKENPSLNLLDLHRLVLFEEPQNIAVEIKGRIDACCSTFEGVCYFMAIQTHGKSLSRFRARQFLEHIDNVIRSRNLYLQSVLQKENILKALDLNEGNISE